MKTDHESQRFDKIQRVPKGLLELLSLAGGQTPFLLDGIVHGQLELLQYYGLTQLQSVFVNNGAVAEGGTVQLNLPTAWCVLFGAELVVAKTATCTDLRGGIRLNRGTGLSLTLREEPMMPFFVQAAVGTLTLGYVCPYPLLCPPGSIVIGQIALLEVDATCNATIAAEFGVLG